MGNLGEINASDLPENESNFEPIPGGTYPAEIKVAKLQDNKKGTGNYISIQWSITGENYAGRVVFDMITFTNDSEEAVKIGRQELRQLMDATGLTRLSHTDQLIGRTCLIRVGVKPADDKYDAGNVVKGYKSNGSQQPSVAAVTGGGASKPAWLNNK